MTIRGQKRHGENPFEIDNARALTRDQVVETFVPVESFWRLLSRKHHILLGSRGSGKTAVVRMLSHDHLRLLNNPQAQAYIDSAAFIGMYVPTRLKWVGGLRNKAWQTLEEKELFFQWRLNVTSCVALLHTVSSCLKQYVADPVTRALKETLICGQLCDAWIGKEIRQSVHTLNDLNNHLVDLEYARQQQLAEQRARGGGVPPPLGALFDMDLFEPLRRGIEMCSRALDFSQNTAWLLCLDEAEFLDEDYMRILNSQMRANSDNLFLKITTKPYCHFTLETNTSQGVDPGHDFEYIYLDRDRAYLETTHNERGRIGTKFARQVIEKRAKASGSKYSEFDLDELLGRVSLVDPSPNDWSQGSRLWKLLEKHCSDETIHRAKTLSGHAKFMPRIGLKLHGILQLRDKVVSLSGNESLDVYSGTTMVLRCTDANPRRIIQILNRMLLRSKRTDIGLQPLTKEEQTAVVLRYSDEIFSSAIAEKQCGRKLHGFVQMLGEYMRAYTYARKLSTDQVMSVEIPMGTAEEDWMLIKQCVGLGLLYPNVNQANPDEIPEDSGTFHLSYALAPHFRLLPRRGAARTLGTIRDWRLRNRLIYDTVIQTDLF